MKQEFYSILSKLSFSFLLILGLSNCEINGAKRETTSENPVIVSRFLSNQYASNSELVQQLYPLLYGAYFAADPNGSLEFWTNPQQGCYFTESFENAAERVAGFQRTLDVESVALNIPGTGDLPLTKNQSNFFYTYSPLDSGSYSLKQPGLKNGALKETLGFSVPSKNANIGVFDLSEENPTAQTLVSPEVPLASDRIVFNTGADMAMAFAFDETVDYVRVTFDDGSNTPEGKITCIVDQNETLFLQQGYFSTFRKGEQGFLEVKFIKVHESSSNVPKLEEGVMVSAMTHIMGTFVYTDEEGNKITESLGTIEFQ